MNPADIVNVPWWAIPLSIYGCVQWSRSLVSLYWIYWRRSQVRRPYEFNGDPPDYVMRDSAGNELYVGWSNPPLLSVNERRRHEIEMLAEELDRLRQQTETFEEWNVRAQRWIARTELPTLPKLPEPPFDRPPDRVSMDTTGRPISREWSYPPPAEVWCKYCGSVETHLPGCRDSEWPLSIL